ncbi:hypothetical protein ICE98_03635 [Lactococcus lactis]|nr:hypothetical protein [Lactococcus lactis]
MLAVTFLLSNRTRSHFKCGRLCFRNAGWKTVGGMAYQTIIVTSKKTMDYRYHIKEWTSVYRMRNTGLARQVAQYADTHFYCTYGGATKKYTP